MAATRRTIFVIIVAQLFDDAAATLAGAEEAEYVRDRIRCDVRGDGGIATAAQLALMGIYEISKILNGPARLDQTLAAVVNVMSSFLEMRLGIATILDSRGEPEIVASAG